MIIIDYRDKRPIYEQVVEKLSNLIITEVLVKDEKLPSVRSLAMELSINPNTIQRAYAKLEQDGYIYTVKGRGNFVCDRSAWLSSEKQQILDELKTDIEKAKALGVTQDEIKTLTKDIFSKI